MRILVTGCAGFIGSHVCERLLGEGYEVCGLDNFDSFYDPAVKRGNLRECLGHAKFRLIEGDIRDSAAVARALEGAQTVVHLAAKAGVRPSIEKPMEYADVNVRGTMEVLEGMRKAGAGKLIFASSSSVYGDRSDGKAFCETDNVDFPVSPYAATKKAGELLCYTYHHLFGMAVSCLRLFTVYGERQRPDLAIYKFTERMERGEAVEIFGDGSMRRDFTYISDTVEGIVRAVERVKGYRIYNLGAGRPVTVSETVDGLERALGRRAKREYRDAQAGDVRATWADIGRAREELGYEPKVGFEEGLRRFVLWYRTKDNHQGTKAPRG